MRYYTIVKKGDGNTVKTVVDEYSFELRYKPKGWEIEGQEEEHKTPLEEQQEVIEREATEKRKKAKNNFNDKLIKEE